MIPNCRTSGAGPCCAVCPNAVNGTGAVGRASISTVVISPRMKRISTSRSPSSAGLEVPLLSVAPTICAYWSRTACSVVPVRCAWLRTARL